MRLKLLSKPPQLSANNLSNHHIAYFDIFYREIAMNLRYCFASTSNRSSNKIAHKK